MNSQSGGTGLGPQNHHNGVKNHNNFMAIRQEIQRFESMHPNIYSIYDLVDLVSDPVLAQQIREHVVCIEDSFVNSQEWTVPRTVPEIRLGILGNVDSGKSALVHRYLTGSYLQEESPEGGRFKKEVNIDGRSYLLLIRDEGGPPEGQFSNWVDAVIFVFSLADEKTYEDVYSYYARMCGYRSAMDVPVILVGTQDAINESNPRVIDEDVAKKLQSDLKKCPYYETCATYGLNVDRVFQDACQRVVSQRFCLQQLTQSRPATPSSTAASLRSISNPGGSPGPIVSNGHPYTNGNVLSYRSSVDSNQGGLAQWNNHGGSFIARGPLPVPPGSSRVRDNGERKPLMEGMIMPLTAPGTPNTIRKNRRRSNILMPKKNEEEKKLKEREKEKDQVGPVGHGRPIPKKQGFLHKRSTKGLNRESRKKKYCVLFDGGRLVYYQSMNDYMSSSHGKEISLYKTTVRVPGQPPTGVQRASESSTKGQNGFDQNNRPPDQVEGVLLTAYEILAEVAEYPPPRTPGGSLSSACDEVHIIGNNQTPLTPTVSGGGTPGVKKRQRRLRNGFKKEDGGDADSEYEFLIHSLDNHQWIFDASSASERDEWVRALQEEIHNSFSERTSNLPTSKHGAQPMADKATVVQTVRSVPGNDRCADCQAQGPSWASLNLGILICIDCSGIHRNLGSHISRVRSLDLDAWTVSLVKVMKSMGNVFANRLWEANLPSHRRLSSNWSRDEKERFIYAKYVAKEFLQKLPPSPPPIDQLFDAVIDNDLRLVTLCLAHLSKDEIDSSSTRSSPLDRRTTLHIAADSGNAVILQLLLWSEANPNNRDEAGRTPLQYAQASKSLECCEILLQNGARSPPSGGSRSGGTESFSFGPPNFNNGYGANENSVVSPNSSFYIPSKKSLGGSVRSPPYKNMQPSAASVFNGQSSIDVLEKLPASII